MCIHTRYLLSPCVAREVRFTSPVLRFLCKLQWLDRKILPIKKRRESFHVCRDSFCSFSFLSSRHNDENLPYPNPSLLDQDSYGSTIVAGPNVFTNDAAPCGIAAFGTTPVAICMNRSLLGCLPLPDYRRVEDGGHWWEHYTSCFYSSFFSPYPTVNA